MTKKRRGKHRTIEDTSGLDEVSEQTLRADAEGEGEITFREEAPADREVVQDATYEMNTVQMSYPVEDEEAMQQKPLAGVVKEGGRSGDLSAGRSSISMFGGLAVKVRLKKKPSERDELLHQYDQYEQNKLCLPTNASPIALMAEGDAYVKAGEFEQALLCYQHCMTIQQMQIEQKKDGKRKRGSEQETQATVQESAQQAETMQLSVCYHKLGHVYSKQGDFEQAEMLLWKALTLRQDVCSCSSPVAFSSSSALSSPTVVDPPLELQLSLSFNSSSAFLHLSFAFPAAASTTFASSSAASVASSLPLVESYLELASLYSEKVGCLMLLLRFAFLLIYFCLLALSLLRLHMSLCGVAQGALDKAEDFYRLAMDIQQQILPNSAALASTFVQLGLVYSDKFDLKRAKEYVWKGVAIQKDVLGEESLELASSYNSVGGLYYDNGELDMADEYYCKALAIQESMQMACHIENKIEQLKATELVASYLVASYNNLGVLQLDKGNLEKSEEYFLKGLAIEEEMSDTASSTSLADSYGNLGSLYLAKGELLLSEKYYSKCLATRENTMSHESAPVKRAQDSLAKVRRRMAREKERKSCCVM